MTTQQTYTVHVTEDQIHDICTDQMFDAINQHHDDAARNKAQAQKDQAYERKIVARDRRIRNQARKAKHEAWKARVDKVAFFSLLSIVASAAALAELAAASVAVPLGVGCGMYAATIVGGLVRERRMV